MTYFLLLPLLLVGATCAPGADRLFYPGTGGRPVTSASLSELLRAVQQGGTVVAHLSLPGPTGDDEAGTSMHRVNRLMLQVCMYACVYVFMYG